jgi:hypothetical protein
MESYTNPAHPGSLGGVQRFLRHLPQSLGNLSHQEALRRLQALDTYNRHKQRKRKFYRNPVLVCNIRHQYMADLMDVSRYSSENGKRKFILAVIDCFSKKVAALALYNKSGETVSKALAKCFKALYGSPMGLQVDHGRSAERERKASYFLETGF